HESWVRRRGAWLAVATLAGGVVATNLLASFSYYNGLDIEGDWTTGSIGVLWNTSVALSLLFACVAERPNQLTSLMGLGWLQHVGKISYGIYLFHLPIIGLTESWMSSLPYGAGL